MRRRAFKPIRHTRGQAPDREWMISVTISEFADRAAQSALIDLRHEIQSSWQDIQTGDTHWAGDRWRMELSYHNREAEATIGWKGRYFIWVFDTSDGYRDLNEMDRDRPASHAKIELMDTLMQWKRQVDRMSGR
jgi:hypothetical protein